MSVDFPRAWQITRETRPNEHDLRCSYVQTDGTLLCDCCVLMQHPEYLDDVMHGAKPEPQESN
jgi:hypothetical protein